MSLTLAKGLAALCIGLLALIAGLLPLRWRQQSDTVSLLQYGEFFAKGVFLGAGIIHLLPDAVTSLASVFPHAYPIAEFIIVLTIWLLFTLEHGLGHYCEQTSTRLFLPWLLVGVLSIHAIIEGLVLGVDNTWASFMIILMAILAHKGAEAFALGLNVNRLSQQRGNIIAAVVLFALMTPVGILGGGIIIRFLQANPGHWVEGIFNAIAAGTFIYLATLDHHHHESHDSAETNVLLQSLTYGLGCLIMALVVFWV